MTSPRGYSSWQACGSGRRRLVAKGPLKDTQPGAVPFRTPGPGSLNYPFWGESTGVLLYVIPSLKLTYSLKIDPWKRRFLLETTISRAMLVLGSVSHFVKLCR